MYNWAPSFAIVPTISLPRIVVCPLTLWIYIGGWSIIVD